MIIKGELVTCKREVRTFNNGEKSGNLLWITIGNVELSKEQKKELDEAYKDTGKKQIPAWIKKFEGYVNVKTQFKLPVRDPEGHEFNSIEDFISEFKWLHAPCRLSLTIKVNDDGEAAIYPKAIIFDGEGEAFNPFSDFDNDEED